MMMLTVHSHCRLIGAIPRAITRAIKDRLSFANPQYIENERRGFSNWNTPQILSYLKQTQQGFVMPRGFTRQLIGMLRSSGLSFQIKDHRRVLPEVGFTFHGELRDYQDQARNAILSRDFASVQLPTGAGKTVVALSAVAARRQPSLVVVHTKELLDQWIDRIGAFLGIAPSDVGVIGNGKHHIGEKITVGLVQSLYKCAADVAPHIGHLIVDECHRAPSRTFTECITSFDCRYMLGLSATPYRRDGLGRLIYWYIGDRVFTIDQQVMVDEGNILPAEVIIRETSFCTSLDPSAEYSKMLSQLTQDLQRNRLIACDVAEEARNGSGICLVLSDRKSHCETIQQMLTKKGIHAEMLTGDLPAKERSRVVDALNKGMVKVLVATGQLIGEGFDCKGLSTLFLATPIKFSGRPFNTWGASYDLHPGRIRLLCMTTTIPWECSRRQQRSEPKCMNAQHRKGNSMRDEQLSNEDLVRIVMGFSDADEEAEFFIDLETMTEEEHRVKWRHNRFVAAVDKARADKEGSFPDMESALNYLTICREREELDLGKMEGTDNPMFGAALEYVMERVDMRRLPAEVMGKLTGFLARIRSQRTLH